MPNSPSPTQYCGHALVIFEGAARIAWHTDPDGAWTPCAVWPGPQARARLAEHLHRGHPLLVVLEGPDVTVPVFQDELDRAPATVRMALLPGPRGIEPADGPSRDVTEARVPFLDWLPAPLRERGTAFLAHSEQLLDRTPLALLPPLLIDEPQHGDRQVRFARRLLPGAVTDPRLGEAIRYLFTKATVTLVQEPGR